METSRDLFLTVRKPASHQSSLQTSRTSSPHSSRLSSSSKSKKVRIRKVDQSKEVKIEDEIFFKDELDSSRVAHDVCADLASSGRTDQDLELSVRRRKIIQDILSLFNLDDVMERYRGDSVNMSLNKHHYRQWLSRSMAEAVSIHSDRQWNDQFRQKVLEEFERKQDIRERKLAEAESQRILKLKLQGIIRDEEEEERTAEMVRRKTASEKRFDKRNTKNHQSLFKPIDIETQMEILNRDESEIHKRVTSRNGDCNSSDGIHGDEEDAASDRNTNTPPTYKSQLGRTNEDTKEVHPQLKEFYEEEDLGQLYREAENLVRTTTRNK